MLKRRGTRRGAFGRVHQLRGTSTASSEVRRRHRFRATFTKQLDHSGASTLLRSGEHARQRALTGRQLDARARETVALLVSDTEGVAQQQLD